MGNQLHLKFAGFSLVEGHAAGEYTRVNPGLKESPVARLP
jgi:hypothetical protein